MSTGRRKATILAGAALVMLLAGCGNAPDTGKGLRMAGKFLKETFQKPPAKAGATDGAAAPAGLAAQVLRAVKGPALLVVLEKNNTLAAMGRSAQNGPYATWTTAAGQTLIFRQGVLSGSRGLGDDLMAAKLANIPALLRARQPGTATRRQYYLDGEGKTYRVDLACTITRGAAQTLVLAGNRIRTTKMAETCKSGPKSGGISVQNTYWVGSGGLIWQSRQWLGAGAGYVVIQRLRH